MQLRLTKQRIISSWQVFFIIIGSSWLAAPALNPLLSRKVSLLSQYEVSFQPFSWLFRLSDIVAALSLIAIVFFLRKQAGRSAKIKGAVLLLIALTFLLDPIITVRCQLVGLHCHEPGGISYLLHSANSVLSSTLLFGLSLYVAVRERSLAATLFSGVQAVFFVLYLSDYAKNHAFLTLAQLIYQSLSVIWLALYVSDLSGVNKKQTIPAGAVSQNIRRAFAVAAYLNGMLALLLSVFHLHVTDLISDIYVIGNISWVSQHGVIVGVTMLYLSRHLARGEHRARLIFLALLFVEIIKYAGITPQPTFLLIYLVTFALLFAMRPFFRRGSVAPDWHARLQEAFLILSGVAASVVLTAFIVSRNQRLYDITHAALKRFPNFDFDLEHVNQHIPRSARLSHTLTLLAVVTTLFLLWSLFRPVKTAHRRKNIRDQTEAAYLLEKHAVSSEDFFKIWPTDKYYFWSGDRRSFIAYKPADSVIFALADPVGEDRRDLLEKFREYWHGRGYTTCFLMVSESSLDVYKNAGFNTLQIGSSAEIDVEQFANETISDKWWRWQKNRSTKAGYIYHISRPPHSNALIQECRNVSRAWLKRPGHRERGFALGTYNDAYLQQCNLHYVTDENNKTIAFTNQLPSFNNLSQTTVDMMRFMPELNNVMPFLLASTIQYLAEEKRFNYFDLGFVPMAKMDNVLVDIAKNLASRQISASGLERFKNKFRPGWRKNYIAYDGDIADLAIIALRIEDAMRPDN
jgi:phosphatidylglycerol lysyltransferase